MSEEEKKAIEWFREDLAEEKENCGKYNDYKKQVIKRNEKLLNLIEKQQKELEQEKEKNKEYIEILEILSKMLDNTAYDQLPIALVDQYISKDKIREKMEELKDFDSDGNDYDYIYKKGQYELCQELLEE